MRFYKRPINSLNENLFNPQNFIETINASLKEFINFHGVLCKFKSTTHKNRLKKKNEKQKQQNHPQQFNCSVYSLNGIKHHLKTYF